MSTIAFKYMPAEMSEKERLGTFAARHDTLDYLTKILRDQCHLQTLNSVLLTGPRGSGKTTLVLMLVHRIRTDEELRAHWLPVQFPEELPAITSLRDLMASALAVLREDGVSSAGEWLRKVEDETEDAQSLELATTGLRQIARNESRRLVMFVENLDMVFERGLTDNEEAHLRRLLMTEPFFMIVGTAVRLFPEVTEYTRAFFNFFNEVPLRRLNDDQVEELLLKRAEYHRNTLLQQNVAKNRPSIRALCRLTGGSPRFVAMLYEVFSEQKIRPVVELLRQLIDELTPLLKDVLERLPPQQSKVLDALMRRGGTASPHELVEPTRLNLNTVTTQLTRLRDAHLVEVYGGGKGRKATYAVPDQLFCTWYQMRYLRPNRRRIEVIVELLRILFSEEERLVHLRQTTQAVEETAHDQSVNSEYWAASLASTIHEAAAREMAVRCWLREGQLSEAAYALAEFEPTETAGVDRVRYAVSAHEKLARFLRDHGDPENAIKACQEGLRLDPGSNEIKGHLAFLFATNGREREAIEFSSAVTASRTASVDQVADALVARGIAKGRSGDHSGEIMDFTAAVKLPGLSLVSVGWALLNRGLAKSSERDSGGAIADFTSVVELAGSSTGISNLAMISRAREHVIKGEQEAGLDDLADAANRSGLDDNMRRQIIEGCALGVLPFLTGKGVDLALVTIGAAASAIGNAQLRWKSIVSTLFKLARPEQEDLWLKSWEVLERELTQERELFEILRPVQQVLRGGPRDAVEALPADQRELVSALLGRFRR